MRGLTHRLIHHELERRLSFEQLKSGFKCCLQTFNLHHLHTGAEWLVMANLNGVERAREPGGGEGWGDAVRMRYMMFGLAMLMTKKKKKTKT